ncbi:MAG: hypothetical protein JW976_10295 [Syntrophaceae bacterium]|nr:hypothetical protein [Syntrophaceae bacterium]
MKNTAKVTRVALLGFIVAFIIALVMILLLSSFAITLRFQQKSSPVLWVIFFGVIPVVFFLGSCLIGYLSHPHLKSWLGFTVVSPGLYPSFLMIALTIAIQFRKDIRIPLTTTLLMFGIPIYWFLSSLAGVWLGRQAKLRREKTKDSQPQKSVLS